MDILKDYDNRCTIIIDNKRPTFKYVVDILDNNTIDSNDINILINSDCFFSDITDWNHILNMSSDKALALSRYDLSENDPTVVDRSTGFPRIDSQDCWIYKGKSKSGMNIDFYFGVGGCDNRMCDELYKAGYGLEGCVSKVHIFHYHRPDQYRHYPHDRLQGSIGNGYTLVQLC